MNINISEIPAKQAMPIEQPKAPPLSPTNEIDAKIKAQMNKLDAIQQWPNISFGD